MRQFNRNIFKAYDIRGKYPKEINEKAVAEIIPAIIRALKPKTIVIGRDVRLSSPKLYHAVIKQLTTDKLQLTIIKAGITTTPMLSFLVNHFKTDGGIMITASHNPKEYNGFKIIGKNAAPISGKEIYELIK